MLELPESYTIARQLQETVGGKRIQNVIAAHSPHGFAFYYGDPQEYQGLLSGRQVEGVEPSAGLVEMRLGDARLVLGDGVNIRFVGPGEKRPPRHQLLLEFDDFSAVVCTVQMYGGLWAFREGENDNFYYLVTKEKPTPFSDAFDESYYNALWEKEKPTLTAKAFLATEQRIPGLGNGVLHDILFRAGIHPKSHLGALSGEEKHRLFESVKGTLLAMAGQGGRDTEKDLFGCTGGYQTLLSSKTWKRPCPQCGGEILRQAYLGGNVYFCPHCQELKK
ncbi:endonuclease VIII [Zongyangia hominis]|uniref:Endonuclease VIII n=1 Tax=Zongyangia hominis TaxID=2763677 RepID=A0A926EBA6_9FIRM|nr:endonuclease VIII [Zongyangia hominis]MBC8570727.1 endonuclease VIII [Zongyangia hominis]